MRWWMPPVIGVGAVAIANACLFTAVFRVHPGKVEAHPYAASVHEDERRAAMHAFAVRGWRIEAAVDGAGASLRLVGGSGPAPAAGALHLYRPDDPALDRDVAWADPALPLRVELPRPGAWQVRLALRDRAGAELAGAIDILRP